MRVIGTEVEAVVELGYRRARSGGGTETVRLRVGRLRVDAVPAGCDGVLVTSDLQGVASSPWGGPPVLLGIALADYLQVWAQQGLLPPPQRLAVLLAGDLYSAPQADVRGASGEVGDVWLAFVAAGCPVVVGVAGNHDAVSDAELRDLGGVATLLDGVAVDRGGIRFAGVGGIIGDPGRFGRRSEQAQLAALGAALAPVAGASGHGPARHGPAGRGGSGPDVLVLHEGPPGDRAGQRGSPVIGDYLAGRAPALTVCGHIHWEVPLARLGDGHVLNVDGRAVLLTPA